MRAWIEVPEEYRARNAAREHWRPLMEAAEGVAGILSRYPDEYPSEDELLGVMERTFMAARELAMCADGVAVYSTDIGAGRVSADTHTWLGGVKQVREAARANSVWDADRV